MDRPPAKCFERRNFEDLTPLFPDEKLRLANYPFSRMKGAANVLVTPGIRPAGGDAADQKRVVDVAQALRNGADYIVVGRPIRDAADPRAAAEAIQKTIAGIFAS